MYIMLFHPGLTVILVVVVVRTAARPWDDSSFLSNDIYNRGYPQDVIPGQSTISVMCVSSLLTVQSQT